MITEVMGALKDVLVLNEKITQVSKVVEDALKELKNHEARIVRLETYVEIGNRQLPGR